MLKTLLNDLVYIFLNYFVANIPCWVIRRFFYKLFGLKIGRGSRINMKCILMAPWRISIGENSMINEHVLLDGRGGLDIGSNCSVSMFSVIYSATHHMNSESFEYYKAKTAVDDNVWIGTHAIVNAGTHLSRGCVLGANSVTSANLPYEEGGVYTGIPAEFRYHRKVFNQQLKHRAFLR